MSIHAIPDDTILAYRRLLLVMSLRAKEDDLFTRKQFDFFKFVILEVCHMALETVGESIGKKCSSSRALDWNFSSFVVRCFSHRFNLAGKALLESYESLKSKNQKIMCTPFNQTCAGKIR